MKQEAMHEYRINEYWTLITEYGPIDSEGCPANGYYIAVVLKPVVFRPTQTRKTTGFKQSEV
jgi:hypothetical protein